MLSDKTIMRDGDPTIFSRGIQKFRKIVGKSARNKLNDTIKKELDGCNFTIFSQNCLGGVFTHDAGRQFTSPTVNLAFDGEDYIKFLEKPEYYLNHDMNFRFGEGIHNYPIAIVDDIEIRFVHYKSFEEAEQTWRRRAKRIIWDNIYVISTNQDGMNTPELFRRFDALPYKNKIMFVSKKAMYPWQVFVPQFNNRFQVKVMTSFANCRGQRYYETCFNIAKWIACNSENGGKQ